MVKYIKEMHGPTFLPEFDLLSPAEKVAGDMVTVSVRPSFRHSVLPFFRPTFLSGAYLQKYQS